MSRSRLYSILVRLHRKHPSDANALPDAKLLERFVQLHDEASFELLVWRHERMVLGVCRRLLRDERDAEDAFQAAFLTLARKASSIGRREAVASWLYKVAYRCALRVREAVQRQRQSIARGIDPANVAVSDPSLAAVEQDDLRDLLDEEVQRLPAKHRAAVVLCYLEGKSYQQAAQELGCSAGTLSVRLHTAREKLRRRLTARGLAPAAALTLLESACESHAAARLAAVVVQAAQRILAGQSAADVVSSRTLEIATGVMQSMSASKPKIIVLMLLIGCVTGLTGWAAWRVLPQTLSEPNAEDLSKPVSVNKDGKSMTWQECAQLRGAVGGLNRVGFSPDGSALAAMDFKGRLRVWNTSNWELRWQREDFPAHNDWFVYMYSFTPDSRFLAVVNNVYNRELNDKKKLTILDAASGRQVALLPGSWIAHGARKSLLATTPKDGVILWDTQSFRIIRELPAHSPVIDFSLAFSKDASLVCVATRSGRCRLWETETGKERASPEGFYPRISADGKTMLTVLPGGIVKLWDTSDGKERATIRKEGRAGCMADFSADGQRLLVWAHMPLKDNGVFVNPPRGPGSRHILPIDVCLYDGTTGAELQQLPSHSEYPVSPQFSSDGRTIAYSRLEPDETEHEEVVLWDIPSGRERAVLRVTHKTQNAFVGSGVRNPFFSPDGATVVTMDASGKSHRLWEAATGRRLLDLSADAELIYFSPDGRWLARTPRDLYQGSGNVRVFHLSDKSLTAVVRGAETKPNPTQSKPRPTLPESPQSEAARALEAVRQESQKFDEEMLPKFREVKAGSERKQLEREWSAAYQRFGVRFLKVARDFPAEPAALEALECVLRSTDAGAERRLDKLHEEAIALILRDHRKSSNLTNAVYRMSYLHSESAEKALVDLAESSPHRPIRGRAAWRLAEALAHKAEELRLIRAQPELLDDPELADRKNRWTQLQKIDPDAVARSAEEWYTKVRDRYADVTTYDGNKETLRHYAEGGLFAVRNLAIGKIALDIDGEDLDGKRFHLNEYRSKVMVLIFCGHWCGPCRQMNPQKQQLVERYAGKPFALVEVNSDDDRETVRRIMRKEKLTWRCWFDGGREGPIARRWGVHSWPTIFVLDGKGVIRYKELRGPMLDRVVDQLVKEAGDAK